MIYSPFQFAAVPESLMEWTGSLRLGEILAARFRPREALLITDAGLVAAGLIDPIEKGLRMAGFRVTIFDEVVADPPENVVLSCAELARTIGAGIVIGVGGGSSLDIAKLVAVLVASGQDLGELYGLDKVKGERLPLVLVPTTAGTGSEMTNISIVTTGETTKSGVVARQLYADFVLLDAALTVGLPRSHTAATGIDAMVHAIEAYTSAHKKNPVSDALAREALRLLSQNLLTACADGANRAARERMLLGAALAGQAFTNAPVAAVHALAYPLGGRHHVPHGLSNALMLGPVLRFNALAAGTLYAELGDLLDPRPGAPIAERAEAFIARIDDLVRQSGAPQRLRDVGIVQSDLPILAADAMLQTRLLMNNPAAVTEADALMLYQQTF